MGTGKSLGEGSRVGSWTITGLVSFPTGKAFQCRCECGTNRLISRSNLASGRSRSCGCQKGRHISEARTTHGKSSTPEYRAWRRMFTRCYNRKYDSFERYGGRGIRVCERWLHSFENFFADMGERPSVDHSLDRKNNNGNYTPKNCRWATFVEQIRNRSNSIHLRVGPETATPREWAKKTGIPEDTIRARLLAGWKGRDAVFLPLDELKSKVASERHRRSRGIT